MRDGVLRWWRVIFAAMLLVAPAGSAGAEPGTLPATRPGIDPALREALLDLDSPDPAAREGAVERLLSIGPGAVGPLRQLLDADPTPEVRARVEHILAEMPRRWKYLNPDGGDLEGGFQATLSATVDGAGTPFLTLEIRACSPAARRLKDIAGVDVELAPAAAAAADGARGATFATPHADARLVLRCLAGGPLPREGSPLVFDRGPARWVELKHGGRSATVLRPADAVELAPGEYEAQVLYYARTRNLVPGSSADLGSNPVRFTVGKRP